MRFLENLRYQIAEMSFSNLYLVIIGVFFAFVFAFLVYALRSTRKKKIIAQQSASKASIALTSQDIKAIAGDNVMATQLDLARAYVEMGKKILAKKILQHVVEHGDIIQQQEANELISALKTT